MLANITEPSKLLDAVIENLLGEKEELQKKNAQLNAITDNLDADTELLLAKIDNLEEIGMELKVELQGNPSDKSELSESISKIDSEKQKLLSNLNEIQVQLKDSATKWESDKDHLVNILMEINGKIVNYFDNSGDLFDKNIVALAAMSEKIGLKSLNEGNQFGKLQHEILNAPDKSDKNMFGENGELEGESGESDSGESESDTDNEEEIEVEEEEEIEPEGENLFGKEELITGSDSGSDSELKEAADEENFFGKIKDSDSENDSNSDSDSGNDSD